MVARGTDSVKRRCRRVARALGWFAGVALFGGAARLLAADSLREVAANFATPPASARPQVWWHWMNGHISRAGITKDLEAMRAVGLGGVVLFEESDRIAPGPVSYGSAEHWALLGFAASECQRLGLEFGFHNGPGWSASGGPWITPEQAMKHVTWSELHVAGGSTVHRLPAPSTRVNPYKLPEAQLAAVDFYRDIVVIAVPRAATATRLPDWEEKAGFKAYYPAQPELPAAELPAIAAEAVHVLPTMPDADGAVTWTVPPGEWTLLRLGYTLTRRLNAQGPTNGGRGLECDKFSREALDSHWAGFVSKVVDVARADGVRALSTVVIDSYEANSQTWTPQMAAEFARRRGYELTRYLPCLTGLVVGSVGETERFLADFRRTLSDLVQENYYGYFAEKCRAQGLRLAVEAYSYKGVFNDFSVARRADIPMGEFWAGIYKWSQWNTKVSASAADLNGTHLVGLEAYTAGFERAAWRWHPYTLKAQGDYFLSRGGTRFYIQASAHQPWSDAVRPGLTMGPHGIQMNRHNTWWQQSKGWLSYLSRSQYLLQQGQLVTDVAFYYGDNAPQTLRAQPHVTSDHFGLPWDLEGDKMGPDLWLKIPRGHDFHVVDEAVLAEMRVDEGGSIFIPGRARYEVLLLPNDRRMSRATLRRVAELVEAGATAVGPRPVATPGLRGWREEEAALNALAARMWGGIDGQSVTAHTYGKGRVVFGLSMADVLAARGVKLDFEYRDRGSVTPPLIDYIHRRLGAEDVYFISNQRQEPARVRVALRVETSAAPEIWHPETGTIAPAPFWQATSDRRTAVDLDLAAAESLFVVFRQPGAARPDAGGFTAFTRNGAAVESVREAQLGFRGDGWSIAAFAPGTYVLTDNKGGTIQRRAEALPPALDLGRGWTAEFPSPKGSITAEFDRLQPWNESANDDIKYFSGTAVFTRDVELSPEILRSDALLELDLGDVQVIAEVEFNGKSVGVLWKPPFRVDLTVLAKPGRNRLVVKVTNLWPNRLIGDARRLGVTRAESEKRTRTAQFAAPPAWVNDPRAKPPAGTQTYTTMQFYSGEHELTPSGLLGPVILRFGRLLPLPVPRRE